VSIALQNAKLFDDVQTMKNYNEAMLESMSNGVLTLDEDRIATCNAAGAGHSAVRTKPRESAKRPRRSWGPPIHCSSA